MPLENVNYQENGYFSRSIGNYLIPRLMRDSFSSHYSFFAAEHDVVLKFISR